MIRRLVVATALALALPSAGAFAQASKDPIADGMPPAEAPADDSGSPLYGYLAFAFFGGAALFAVCRSSRRS